MEKKITLSYTKAQFGAMVDMVDTISGMIGVGSDFINRKNIRLVDRALNKAGYKRKFK